MNPAFQVKISNISEIKAIISVSGNRLFFDGEKCKGNGDAKCLTYYRETGLAVMLIDDSAYELLLHDDKQTILRNYLYTLLMVVLMLSGIFACEKTAHMEMALHTLYRGRLQTLLRKITIMLGICIIGTLSVHLVQFFQIEKAFGVFLLIIPMGFLTMWFSGGF